jgi:hypothetical protein
VYGGAVTPRPQPPAQASENLQRFFAGKAKAQAAAACCSANEQATCCEPTEKATCCGAASAGGCGCR